MIPITIKTISNPILWSTRFQVIWSLTAYLSLSTSCTTVLLDNKIQAILALFSFLKIIRLFFCLRTFAFALHFYNQKNKQKTQTLISRIHIYLTNIYMYISEIHFLISKNFIYKSLQTLIT